MRLYESRSSAHLQVASFEYDLAGTPSAGGTPVQDSAANTTAPYPNPSGTGIDSFGATGKGPWYIIKLPPKARILGGQLDVTVAGNDTGTQTVALGFAGSATALLGATSIKSTGRTALTAQSGVDAATPRDILLTAVNTNGDATAGHVIVTVFFCVSGKANEVVPN